MATTQEQIEALKVKEAQIRARRGKLEARIEAKARKERDRRVFLVGMAVSAAVKRGEISQDQVRAWLDAGTVRAWDREFLGLAPLEGGEA